MKTTIATRDDWKWRGGDFEISEEAWKNMKLPKKLPIYDGEKRGICKVIGTVTELEIEGDKVLGTVNLFPDKISIGAIFSGEPNKRRMELTELSLVKKREK